MAEVWNFTMKVKYDERIEKLVKKANRIRRAYRWTRAVRRHGGR